MSEKSINYETQYKSLKSQYDTLLQKNQNDVIKIKQKQKQLNEQLSKLKKEKEENDTANQKYIQQLKQQIQKQRSKQQKGELTVTLSTKQQEKIKDLQMDVRSLMDQNITLTSQNTVLTQQVKTTKYTNQTLTHEIQRLKQYLQSIQKQSKEHKQNTKANSLVHQESQSQSQIFTQEDIKALKEQLSRAHKQLDRMSTLNIDLQHRLKGFQEETKHITERQRRSMALLKKRESELMVVQAENDKLKNQTKLKKRKTQNNDSLCIKCKQFEQQIQLLKQMVKSTKGMVRVKEIQVEKYRMHNSQEIKDNKSSTKGSQKISSLPPLKKKQNQ